MQVLANFTAARQCLGGVSTEDNFLKSLSFLVTADHVEVITNLGRSNYTVMRAAHRAREWEIDESVSFFMELSKSLRMSYTVLVDNVAKLAKTNYNKQK